MDDKLLKKLCFDLYQIYKEDLNKIQKYSEVLKISLYKFLLYVYYYIEENINKPEYVKLLDTLSLLNSNEEINSFFETKNIDYKYLNNNLLAYYINYRPHIYYFDMKKVSMLRNKITMYENYLYRKLDPTRVSKEETIDEVNVIKEFINSNYSKRRFCFNKRITGEKFKTYIAKVKKIDKELYNEYLDNIKIKEITKSQLIKEDIVKILQQIKENPDFAFTDLLLMTNYDFIELIEASDEVLSVDDVKLFRKFVKRDRKVDSFKDERLTRLFKTDFTYNIDDQLINITEQDTYAIISFLNSNNIPIYNDTFRDCCIKLCKSKLNNITKKQK